MNKRKQKENVCFLKMLFRSQPGLIRIALCCVFVFLSIPSLIAATTVCRYINFRSVSQAGWGPDSVAVLVNIRIDRVTDSVAIFTILSVSPFDTAVFAIQQTSVSVDTAIFPIQTVDSFRIINNDFTLTPGDTLKDFFIILSVPGGGAHVGYAVSKGCFLSDSNPPFPVTAALASFNQYVDTNKIYKGYFPPSNGVLKFGPVYWLWGDIGWSLTAYHDSTAWYFQQHAGDGDCPMGCTGGMDATYRILANGFVERVACTSYSTFASLGVDYCAVSSIKSNIKARPLISSVKGNLLIYSLSGRYCGKVQSLPLKKGGSGIAHLNLKPGAYIIRPEKEKYRPFLYTIIP
jgi:hypothetical protein